MRREITKGRFALLRDAGKRYSPGRVSLERAAAEAGVSVREMMQYLKENKISGQYDLEDLDEDLKNYYATL